MRSDLIKTTLSECSLKDRFHVTDAEMERTTWAIEGYDLFGNVIAKCIAGTYENRTLPANRTVYRYKRLIEIF